jgi:hypothetical protein
MGSNVQSKAIRALKRNLLVMKFLLIVRPIIDQKFFAELKKVYTLCYGV